MRKIDSSLFLLFPVLAFTIGLVSCQPGRNTAEQGSGLVEVIADPGIDPAQLRVHWVSPERTTITVFENGMPTKAAIPRASKDLFEFTLAEKVIGAAGISRSRDKNRHDFVFRIFRVPEERDPFIHMTVKGPDSTNGYFVKRYVRNLIDEITREEFYDASGMKAYETFSNYDRNGELMNTNKYEYTYDNWGYKASQEHFSWSPGGELKHRARNTFRHDEQGNMLEMTYTAYEPDGKIKTDNTNRYTYNDRGLVHERAFISYDPSGSLVNHFITEYLYNEAGTAVKEILYDANRRKINMLERTLNEEGALLKEALEEYNPDGSAKSYHGREYDVNGQLLREF